MNRKIAILAILFGALMIGLPIESSAAVKDRSFGGGGNPQISVSIGQPRRRYYRRGYRRGYYNGYRNYGQYRRTQVGWRRYRMQPRYYWRDGRRYTTYRRVYYYR